MEENKDKYNKLLIINSENELRIVYIKQFIMKYALKLKSTFKIIFFIIFCLTIYLSAVQKEVPFDFNAEFPQFTNLGKLIILNKETIIKINRYMDICKQGILMDNITYKLTDSPKISVIIALYNGGKYLKYSLRSIQNQDLKDIEIILVNDASVDDTLEIVKKYMKEDPRIRLINNEKNRRILFSKSIGALYSNGEYIVNLDQDDMFITNNAFSVLYKEAKKENLDLIQFQDLVLHSFHLNPPIKIGYYSQFIFHNEDIYLEQPDIKNNFFDKFNFILWGLLIKSELYKKVVKILWPIIINYRITHYEDYHITFLLAAFARNFEFMNYYFIGHFLLKNSAGNGKTFKKEEILSRLFFMNSIIEFHIKNNIDDIRLIINYIIYFKDELKKFKKAQGDIFDFVMKKLNYYLSYNQKLDLIKNYKVKYLKLNNTYEYFINKEEFNSILSYQNLIRKKSKPNIKNYHLYPRFSIIIYSIEPTFLNITLNSIQNQDFDNFEIIIICDLCQSLLEITELIKDYNNIELITYDEKKGLLYLYSEAVMKSKGEYILTINSGCALATNDTLSKLNNFIITKEDVYEFNLFINNKELITDNSLRLYRCTHFDSNIDISPLIYNQNYQKIDQEKELLINKLIKSNTYKRIIAEYLYLYKNNIIYNYFDEIIFFIFNKINIKIKKIDLDGIIEYQNEIKLLDKFMEINNESQKIKDSLFYINFLFDNTQNDEKDKLFTLYEFYNIMNIIYNKNNDITGEGKKLISKFLDCNYIPKYNKNLLRFYYNALIDRKIYDLI